MKTLHWTKWPMTQIADGHLGPDLYCRWPFRPVSNGQWWTFETSDVTRSQKSTLVYTLNPGLIHRFIIAGVPMY